MPFGPSTTSGATKESFANDAPVKSLRMSINVAITTCHGCTLLFKVPVTPSSTDTCTGFHLMQIPNKVSTNDAAWLPKPWSARPNGQGTTTPKCGAPAPSAEYATRQATTHHIPAKGFPEYIVTSATPSTQTQLLRSVLLRATCFRKTPELKADGA